MPRGRRAVQRAKPLKFGPKYFEENRKNFNPAFLAKSPIEFSKHYYAKIGFGGGTNAFTLHLKKLRDLVKIMLTINIIGNQMIIFKRHSKK